MYYVTCGVESPCFRMLPQVCLMHHLEMECFANRLCCTSLTHSHTLPNSLTHSLTHTLKISSIFHLL